MYLKENKIYNDDQNSEQIELMYQMITSTFGKELANKITHARFDFKEFDNIYFIAKYEETWVQIRIPKSKFVWEFENEYIVIKNFKDYLFVKDGIFIKKWFPGVDLFQLKLTNEIIYSILNCVKNFQFFNVDIKKFNWNKFKIFDKKYHELLHKYKDDELVLSHNDIQKHNIIVNKYGFVKLVDFDNVSLNSPYFDLVLLHINIGISKKIIIDFFNLNEEKFDDYMYLVNTFREAEYKKDYRNLTINKDKAHELLNVYKTKTSTKHNKFIVHKQHNQFDNRLKINKIEHFYFVPTFIYEDENKIIWRWLTRKDNFELNIRTIKILAKIMRMYHDSDVIFPDYILDEKVFWYLDNINKKDLFLEIGDNDFIEQIIEWIKNIKIDANCHNNLNLDSILWGDNQNIYLIDWSVAYRSSRFLDIALMFENFHVANFTEDLFWKTYGMNKPQDFYKYKLIALFTEYLYNKVLNNDNDRAKKLAKRIKQILVEQYNSKK